MAAALGNLRKEEVSRGKHGPLKNVMVPGGTSHVALASGGGRAPGDKEGKRERWDSFLLSSRTESFRGHLWT